MTEVELAGKRVLLLGAETELGQALAASLTEAGASLAVVAATNDAEAAFAAQRLARRLSAVAQAIDASNEMAVRVMVRQVSKELGGLEAFVFCTDLGSQAASLDLALRFGGRELARGDGGRFVLVGPRPEVTAPALPLGVQLQVVDTEGSAIQQAVSETLEAVAGPPHKG